MDAGDTASEEATPDTEDTVESDALSDSDTQPDADTELASDSAIDSIDVDTSSPLNACGGTGFLTPGAPGSACGDCGDGELVCDPSDPDKNRTRCVDASLLNACGGCGVLAGDPGDACDACGQYQCDERSALSCVEPQGGCEVPLTCADLSCGSQGRACTESVEDVDAICGDCLATHALVDAICRPRSLAPAGVSASTDRAIDVQVSWQAAGYADGYRVYRCVLASCADNDWVELTSAPLQALTWDDQSAAVPAAPSAPAGVEASDDRTDEVVVSWDVVTAPLAPRYRYRVTSVNATGESAPSAVVDGWRAERPVIGYEVRVGDTWNAVDGLATTWTDAAAPTASLVSGSVVASQGTYAEYVRLSASGSSSTAGEPRVYAVRAVTAYGPAAASSVVQGHRVTGPLSFQWERSSGASAADFSALPGADETSFDDTSAPSDGSTRWYRLRVGADGASAVTTDAVAGARQPPPGVPGNVQATSDLTDHVLVSWTPVSGALGYHVYRDGTKLTSGTGITATSYQDMGAAAPTSAWAPSTSLTATTNLTDRVTMTWTAPTRPLGASASYRVQAVNAAGDGEQSTEAIGRRAAPALTGFEVEVTPTGGNAIWYTTGSTTATWSDMNPPKGTIGGGTLFVGQDANRAFVRLSESGASTTSGANVSYRVRGLLQGGSTTQTSGSATGRRAVGTLTRQWQRSSGTSASGFASLTGATGASFDDTTAPSDGGKRWYQLVLSAAGADAKTLGPSQGWRLAFVFIDGGDTKTVALTTDGHYWIWGDNAAGVHFSMVPVAGLFVPSQRLVEVRSNGNSYDSFGEICARGDAGGVWCGVGSTGDLDPINALTAPAASIAMGELHRCVALTDGTVRCWGPNDLGQLGNNSTSTATASAPTAVLTAPGVSLMNVVEIDANGAFTCARRSGGSIACWGSNDTRQIGPATSATFVKLATDVTGVTGAVEIVLGTKHACARLGSGSVKCWGAGTLGELGNGVMTTSATPVTVSGITTAVELDASGSTTCARLASGSVQCWGADGSGWLGNGSPGSNSASPVGVQSVGSATALGGGKSLCALVDFVPRCWGDNQLGTVGDGASTNRFAPVSATLP